jgi:hypothetical protein
MAHILEHCPLEPDLKLILLGIANHSDDTGGNAFPGIQTLMAYSNLSESTVQRKLKYLEGEGLLIREINAGGTRKTRGDRRPNMYTLTCLDKVRGVNWVTPREENGVSKQGGSKPARGVKTGGKTGSRGVTHVTPEPSLNRPLKATVREFEPEQPNSGQAGSTPNPEPQQPDLIEPSHPEHAPVSAGIDMRGLEVYPAPPADPFAPLANLTYLESIRKGNPNADQTAFLTLWGFFTTPALRQANRDRFTRCLTRIPYWLELPPGFVIEVVSLARTAQGVTGGSHGACETWLDDPGYACRLHEHLRVKLEPTITQLVPPSNGLSMYQTAFRPGIYRTPENTLEVVTGLNGVEVVTDDSSDIHLSIVNTWEFLDDLTPTEIEFHNQPPRHDLTPSEQLHLWITGVLELRSVREEQFNLPTRPLPEWITNSGDAA